MNVIGEIECQMLFFMEKAVYRDLQRVNGLGKSVLVISDKPMKDLGYVDRVMNDLHEEGIHQLCI